MGFGDQSSAHLIGEETDEMPRQFGIFGNPQAQLLDLPDLVIRVSGLEVADEGLDDGLGMVVFGGFAGFGSGEGIVEDFRETGDGAEGGELGFGEVDGQVEFAHVER